ncbi:MAG: hypothetical protein ACHRXM_05515 [Isosphaerales bacterium]
MNGHDPPSGYYYYAAGERVRLNLDEEWVAVDARRSEAANATGNLRAALRDASKPLRGDLVLVRRNALSSQQLDALAKQGAIHPVFHAEGAMLVALPEVRVEESSPHGQEALHDWLRKHRKDAEIVEDRGDRIVLRPTSGRGQDALTLANHLSEQVGPKLAQPRFLRIVDRFER